MNTMHPDFQLELTCQKIEKDKAFILKEKMFKSDPDFGAVLNQLGTWMVAKGEYLRKHYAISKQNTPLALLQDQSSIFKA